MAFEQLSFCSITIVAILIFYLQPDYKIADPICTFLFSVLVLVTTLTIMRDIIHVLMEGIGVFFYEL